MSAFVRAAFVILACWLGLSATAIAAGLSDQDRTIDHLADATQAWCKGRGFKTDSGMEGCLRYAHPVLPEGAEKGADLLDAVGSGPLSQLGSDVIRYVRDASELERKGLVVELRRDGDGDGVSGVAKFAYKQTDGWRYSGSIQLTLSSAQYAELKRRVGRQLAERHRGP